MAEYRVIVFEEKDQYGNVKYIYEPQVRVLWFLWEYIREGGLLPYYPFETLRDAELCIERDKKQQNSSYYKPTGNKRIIEI